MRRPLVAIIGSSVASESVLAQAEALGAELARLGLSIVCGGRSGVMEAVCRGHQAARARGEAPTAPAPCAMGLLPDSDTGRANAYLDFALPTGIGFARNSVITLAADVVIAVAGSSGTLSEIAYAWQYGKPLCALRSSGGWAAELAGRCLDDRHAEPIFAADSPSDAAAWAARRLSGGLDRA